MKPYLHPHTSSWRRDNFTFIVNLYTFRSNIYQTKLCHNHEDKIHLNTECRHSDISDSASTENDYKNVPNCGGVVFSVRRELNFYLLFWSSSSITWPCYDPDGPSLSCHRRAYVWPRIRPSEICGVQSGIRTVFSQNSAAFPSQYHSTNAPC